jgi:hypothetical protein
MGKNIKSNFFIVFFQKKYHILQELRDLSRINKNEKLTRKLGGNDP